MNRRDSVLALLAMGATTAPICAFAQAQSGAAPLRIGLVPDFRPDWMPLLSLFTEGLRELGRVEGRDYVFIRSGLFYADDPRLALERVLAAKPDLILVSNLGYAIAAQKASQALPVVMWISGFPVEGGVAQSLNRRRPVLAWRSRKFAHRARARRPGCAELGDPQPLLVYKASSGALIRQAAPYVNQILWKGAKPGDLPIQLPARFEFQVNLKTAKAIGVSVPPSILVRADKEIE